MKRLISVILVIAMVLSLAACEGKTSDRKISEVLSILSEAFSDYTVEKGDVDSPDYFEFKSDYYICSLISGENIYIYSFDSEKQAQKHASNYSPDGSGYSWAGLFGRAHGTVIDYALPVHFWLSGNCVIEYGGNDSVAEKLAELFGEQFAGDGLPVEIPDDGIEEESTDDEADKEHIGPEHVIDLAEMLDKDGMYLETVKEDDSGYSYDSFEHRPEDCYIIRLTNGESVYIRVYDSAETAADEASNYGPDGSEYAPKSDIIDEDGNMLAGMIIDYIAPVHFWLSGECIVQYCSFDNAIALMLQGYLGEQFAGMPIEEADNTLDDAQIRYTVEYARVSVGETELCTVEPIGSREALENYCQALKDSYYWSPYTEPYTEKFEELTANYPAEWFENNSLIIVRTYSGSIPVEYTVEEVIFTDGKYVVTISSEAGEAEAIEEGCLLIGLEGVKLTAESEIELIADPMILSDPVKHEKEQLTLEKLIELDESGKKLSWSDFEQYESDDIGSGLYILRYFLRDRGYLLLIGGGSLNAEPMYIKLSYVYQDRTEECEVGGGNVREFVERMGN